MHRPSRIAAAATRHLIIVALAVTGSAPDLAAQDQHHDDHQHGAHFTHPLFAEFVSPDTKLRLDYSRQEIDVDQIEKEVELEAEYAFTDFFSIEAGTPRHRRRPGRGDSPDLQVRQPRVS